MEVTENIFTGGLNMDISELVKQGSTLTYAKNIRIVDLDSSTFSITNLLGTESKFQLTAGFLPIGSKSYNNVLYIISHNSSTHEGEIGSFPSPNYIDGLMEQNYKPFKNYNGDVSLGVGVYGDFRSEEFNFDLTFPVRDIEIQNEYDGTVNVIFTDNRNPIRIINSRFVVNGGKYEIVDREGKDTNLYIKDNFNNIINLFIKSNKILKINFEGIIEGGKVEVGNYVFYFRYTTQDLNQTEVIGQSFTCSVFHGNKVANTRGGKEGEETNKQIKFNLSNLDQAYRYLKVSYVVSVGEVDAVKSAYSIDVNYPILGNSVDFSFTGFENKTRINIDSLSVTYSNIDTARTITQTQGYLMAGNIKEKKYDKESLETFSKFIQIGFKERQLDIIGVDSTNQFYTEVIDQSNPIKDGWNGAYYNPKNIYGRLSYWGGEAYSFGIVYIFPDGTLSPVFPCVGVDNVANNRNDIVYTESQIDQIFEDRFNNTTGENGLGVYRFPNRNSTGVAEILNNTDDSYIVVNGVTFKIPSGTVYTNIKRDTIGCFFVRSKRIPDVLGQGYLVPTVKAQGFADYFYDHSRVEWDTTNESTYKVLPMIRGMIETVRKHPASGGDTNTNFLFKFQRLMLSGVQPVDQKRYGFLSNDNFVNSEKAITTYNNRDVSIKKLANVIARGDSGYTNSFGRSSFSLFHTIIIAKGYTNEVFDAKTYWTVGNFEGKNAGLFSSLEYHLEGKRNEEKFLIWASWNDYVGVELKSLTTIDPGALLTSSAPGQTGSGVVLNEDSDYVGANEMIAFLANVYPGSNQKTTTQVGSIYDNIESFQYFPISERLYWSEIEAQMDVNRKITCFNGDCFVGMGHRINYLNKEFDQSKAGTYDDINIGNAISIVTESNHNVALRHEEMVDPNTLSVASFMPYLENASNNYTVFRKRKYRFQESKAYLKGYSEVKGDKQYIVIPQGVPYIASNWFTRIIASERHIPNSFENGYRKFLGLNFQDYDTTYGAIVKICTVNGQLICIQEHGVSIIPVNDRVLAGGDTAGSVFIQTPEVLSKYTKKISEKFGSKNQGSILATDNTVYGIDTSARKIWRIEGEGLKFISDFSISSFMPRVSVYEVLEEEVGFADIITTLDKRFDEVIFTFIMPNPETSYTICYNEALSKFITFYTFTPMHYGMLGDTIYSFVDGFFHEHNVKTQDRNLIYDTQQESVIEFLVNSKEGTTKAIKVFDSMIINSNEISPVSIEFFTENQSAIVLAGYDEMLEDQRIKYKEKKFAFKIPESTILVDTNELLEWADEARFRDKYLRVRITWNSTEKIKVDSVDTYFRYSRS